MSDQTKWSDATLAIHGNRVRDTHTNSILFPICQSATFAQDTVGVAKGHSYSRVSNPTVDAPGAGHRCS